MDGWVGGWVAGWVGGWLGGWLDGWVAGWMSDKYDETDNQTPYVCNGVESEWHHNFANPCQKRRPCGTKIYQSWHAIFRGGCWAQNTHIPEEKQQFGTRKGGGNNFLT